MTYTWPGNVRELKHAVERACIPASGPMLGPEAFFDTDHDGKTPAQPVSESLAEYLMARERDYLTLAPERHGGHMTDSCRRGPWHYAQDPLGEIATPWNKGERRAID